MTVRQSIKRTMNQCVSNYLQRMPAEVRAGIPGLQAALSQLKKANKDISGFCEKQTRTLKEVSKQKEERRAKAIDVALDVSAKMIGYAKNVGDMDLYGAVNYRKRDLVLFTDAQCEAVCRVIHKLAVGVVDLMSGYNLTKERLDDFMGRIEKFSGCVTAPKDAIDKKAEATAGIKASLLESDALLEKLDTYIDMLRLDQPRVHAGYFMARKLRKPGFRKLSGRGWVRDASGAGLSGVVMRCEALGLVKRLEKSGGFRLFHIKAGEYEFVFEKEGYERVVVRVWFNKGERSEIGVVMSELGFIGF